MVEFKTTTNRAYGDIIEALLDEEPEDSRAGEMREILGVTVRSPDPRERWRGREKFNLPFALQEGFAYWRGLNPGHVHRYNSNMEQWLEGGELPGSAYGDRMRNTAGHDQLARAERQLRESRSTRRSVVQVHQAAVEDYDGGDVSCTNHLHFFVRGGELHCHASIRSQDMFWGYVYDSRNNQYLQEVLAGRLGLDLGEYVHTMESCHLYTSMEDAAWESLGSPRRWASPDLRLDAEAHGPVMDILSDGLAEARTGGSPTDAYNQLAGFANGFYADQLAVMTAYEQGRFHDEPEAAEHWAEMVDHEPFTGWLERWLDGRQF